MLETRTAPPKVKTTADVLRHAARIIEERGWSDDEPECEDGRRCAGSAISLAATGLGWESDHPLVKGAAVALLRHLGKNPIWPQMGGVANWNDREAGSSGTVIAALRAAADAAEAA